MDLKDLVARVAGFDDASPKEQIKLFAWWLHTDGGKELFGPTDIRACYDALHMSQQAIATYLSRMVESKDLLREKTQYKLARSVRTGLEQKYGESHNVVAVSKLLTDLVGKVPNLAEQTFLAEAIKCYRVEAYRACIVMVWNVTYNHLLNWILSDASRISKFNTAIVKRNSKKAGLVIVKYDDFEDLKEREVVDIANTAGLFNSGVYKILVSKLDRRNIAAHPSAVVMVQSQADDTITDLVNNVILGL